MSDHADDESTSATDNRIVKLDFSMNITDNNFRGLLIALLCCAMGFAGCREAKESHDDEHLEHFVPAHKPKDFG